ncbi:MAG: hypothetical protein ACKOEQ_01710 [Verrucomicrobiota bacterium]
MNVEPVRILHFSPGTATGRHDSLRAAMGVAGCRREAAFGQRVDQPVELVEAYPAIASREAVATALQGAAVLAASTPTYAQGSPWFVRRFFELSAGLAAWGTPATAFATSGGLHTGAEMALADTFRSLQGLGMATFTFAQKWVALGVQQRPAEDGSFDLVDAWFLRQLARTMLLHAMAARGGSGMEWAARLGLETDYYRRFQSEAELRGCVGAAMEWMNAPLAGGGGWAGLRRWSGHDAAPPDVSAWPHAALFPRPPGEPPAAA